MVSILKAATTKPKALTQAGERAITAAAHSNLLQMIQELEQHAHGLGLLITARSLNNAKNACGWEIAGDAHAADLAAKGERRS